MHDFLKTLLICASIWFLCCAPSRAAASVTVSRIEAAPLRAASAELSAESLRLIPAEAGKSPSQIPRAEVISLQVDESPETEPPSERVLLEFANGDRLLAELSGFEKGQLHIRVFGESLAVPLGQLRGIVFHGSTPSATRPARVAATDDRGWPLLFREEGTDDVALLTNGDRLAGRFLGGDERQITLSVDGRPAPIPRQRLEAIAFSPELISDPRSPTRRQIVFGPSGWLTVTGLLGKTSRSLQATTLFGEAIEFQPGEFRRVLFLGPRVVSLTDLEPVQIEYTPWLRRVRPVHWNRSLTSRPLALSGTEYARGIGIHSATTITYSLEGNYDRFMSLVGLAESAGSRGRVSISVAADGQSVIQRRARSRAHGAVSLDVPLDEAKTLTLQVGFGPGGNIRDRVNWCRPLLLKVVESGEEN